MVGTSLGCLYWFAYRITLEKGSVDAEQKSFFPPIFIAMSDAICDVKRVLCGNP
jgi:hypothetical protein